MDSIIEIIRKIETPLLFGSEHSFKHLHLLKDLDGVMKKYLNELDNSFSNFNIMTEKKPLLRDRLAELRNAMNDFDSCSYESKKVRIETALKALYEIKLETNSSPIRDHDYDTKCACFEKLAMPIKVTKGIGPKIALLLEKKGLKTIEDMLYFIPRQYEDRRAIKTISSLIIGRKETVVGEVTCSQMRYYGKKKIFEVTIDDNHGIIKAKWFRGNQSYLKTTFTKGKRIILTGEVSAYFSELEMLHPDFEVIDKYHDSSDMLHFGRIVPIYSEAEGLHQKNIRRIMMEVVTRYSKYVLSPIPKDICLKRQFGNISDSITNVHFPGINENIETFNALQSMFHKRLIYDELFFFELGMALRKKGNALERGNSFKRGGRLLVKFYKMLPFSLTKEQEKAIRDIEDDMVKPFPMNRLLQGDVGCGKTVVAMASMITACENGYQAVIMAPTEILAEQHHARIAQWAEKLELKVAIITGSRSLSEKRKMSNQIKSGDFNIIIGTHALIQDEVTFNKLGLVIIDEQHRFGVIQRATIRKKGQSPHVLVMTATPIPRTLAMTVYGDLDYSVINEMPPGRKPIRTKVFYEHQRNRVYEFVHKELAKGNQVFIVYPFVEESENLDLKDATRMAAVLQKDIFPEYRIGLIHGRTKGRDKDKIMLAFLEKKIQILVSTTIIEVGIDVPNASMMIIEHADRFGLSQLHQLRGRIGRGQASSYCILMADQGGTPDSKRRLRIMEDTNDGFRIAEEDLAIRGPGEFMGTRQSGVPDFRIANIVRDFRILYEAKEDANTVIEGDPHLKRPEHQAMKAVLLHRWAGRLDLAKTS